MTQGSKSASGPLSLGTSFWKVLIHFSRNSFIHGDRTFIVESYICVYYRAKKNPLYATIIKFDWPLSFDCILYFLMKIVSHIISCIVVPCTQWCYKTVTVATLAILFSHSWSGSDIVLREKHEFLYLVSSRLKISIPHQKLEGGLSTNMTEKTFCKVKQPEKKKLNS